MRRLFLSLLCVLLLRPEVFWGAWGTDTGRCTAVEEVSDSAISCTIGSQYTVNDAIIVVFATDNVSTTDGQTSLHSSVTDSDNNTYTKQCEFTNGQGAAAAGATVSIWTAVAGATLADPDIITANTGSDVTDKVIFSTRLQAQNNTTLDLQNIPAGIYFIRVQLEN